MTYVINGVKIHKDEFLRLANEASRLKLPLFSYIAQTLTAKLNDK
jgi:hypothetical protein